MAKFILKRVLNLIPTFIVASILIFLIVRSMPGDPVSAFLGMDSRVPPETRELIAEQLGLNRSLPEQYIRWMGRILTGDLGSSIQMRTEVSQLIGPMIRNTFLLNFVAFLLAVGVAIPVGIKQAVKKYKGFDNTMTVISLFGISIPSFFFAFILLFFVAIPLGLPLNGMRNTIQAALGNQTPIQVVLDVARHMIIPVIILAFGSFAGWTRYVRNAMIDVLNQDYVRTARSKGLKEKVVIYRHAFKNALIPLVTLLGFSIPALFSGALITETIFQWPGIGRGLMQAIGTQDQSVILACLVFFCVLILIGNLLADILYSVVDPRIKSK